MGWVITDLYRRLDQGAGLRVDRGPLHLLPDHVGAASVLLVQVLREDGGGDTSKNQQGEHHTSHTVDLYIK